jgi:hypothetical protein
MHVNVIRDLIEIHTLLDVFSHDLTRIPRWREVTNAQRLDEFSPASSEKFSTNGTERKLPNRLFCGLPVLLRLGASAPAPPQIHCAEPGADEQQRRRFGYRGAVVELVADTVGVDPDPWQV